MDIDINKIFAGVQNSIQHGRKQGRTQSLYDKIISLKKPENGQKTNKYVFRILPYVKEPEKTFFYYEKYFWPNDKFPGRFYNILSRRTFGEPCPICNEYFRLKNNGNTWEKERAKREIGHKVGWYCNVYVVSDPVEPANNGQVMILSLNMTLHKKVEAAINGELDEEWTARARYANPSIDKVSVGRMVTDLSDNGVNFVVNINNRGGFPDYNNSDFTNLGADLHLTPAQQDEILSKCVDVSTVEKEWTADEALKLFNETYLHISDVPQQAAQVAVVPQRIQTPVAQAYSQPAYTPTPSPIDEVVGGDQIPGLEPTPAPAPQQIPDTEAEVDSFLKQLSKKKDSENSNVAPDLEGFNFGN